MKRKLIIVVLSMIVSICSCGVSFSVPLRDGYYEIQAMHSGKCLDVPRSSRDDSVEVIQYTCGNTTNQRWKLTEGPSGQYEIQAMHSGKCLDVPRSSRENNTKIIQYRCGNTTNQRWKITEGANGKYEIRATHSNKCLDVPRSSRENNAKIIQYRCGNTTNQRWELSYKGPATETASVTEELYLVDVRETPGKILQLLSVSWRPSPVLRPVYARSSEYIHTIAFHGYGRAYFVDLSHRNIYATDGLTEERIFTFSTPIQDLDFDSRGRMYFSAIGGDEGVLYLLNRHSGRTSRIASFSFQSLADQTRGFWNGYFAFSPSDKLFLSIDDTQPGGSSIYEYSGGQLRKRFTHNERITGFTFVDETTIYFTNSGSRIYELKRFSDISVKHEEGAGRMLNDVELVKVPKSGNCTISGKLQGGSDLWSMTSVQALGPNVLWRTIPDSSMLVSRDGSYTLGGLPNGRYRVSTDIRGDTMSGFNPRARMVNCGSAARNINFTFSQ